MSSLTAGPGHDDAPVPAAVRVPEAPVLVDPPEEESRVQQDQHQREEDELEVVAHVRDGELRERKNKAELI